MRNYIILLAVLLSSCSSKNEYWDFLVKDTNTFHVIMRSEKNVYYETTAYYLKTSVYDLKKGKLSYRDFFYDLLENKKADEIPDYLKRELKFDKGFYEEYKSKGFSHIKSKYLVADGEAFYTDLRDEKLDTLLIVLFENDYRISFSDLSGEYRFKYYK